MFTGDRSADWLIAALWRAGYANQPTSTSITDGLAFTGAWMTAAVRCAPPANKPTPDERDPCLPFLARELALLENLAVIVVLGGFAYQVVAGLFGLKPRPKFGHLVEARLPDGRMLVCSITPVSRTHSPGC